MAKEKTGYRFYYDKDYDYLLQEELKIHNEYSAKRSAKSRLRMYANLFSRDVKKILIKDGSCCAYCGSTEKLEVDHIIPVAKGGRNELSNTQVLCEGCNMRKGDRIG